MSFASRLTSGLFRLALAALAILFVLVLALVLFIGFVPAGSRLAAQAISSMISTADRSVTIAAPRGLLTGNLAIDSVVLADRNGTYAEARDIAVAWSPLALLGGTFHADSVSIGNLSASRAPAAATVQPQQTDDSSSGFSLPIDVRVDRLSLPNIELGEDLAGRDFELAAEGAVNASDDRIALQLRANRKDAPNAVAKTDLVFAPAQNELKLELLVAEPQGGLLARLLHLPGNPSLALALDGRGPLSNWAGRLRGTVNGAPVISVDGQHTLSPNGTHRIEISGGGQLAELLPPAFRPLFAGRTDVNLAALLTGTGRVEIKDGLLTNGAMKLAASGAVDPSGDNSLTASVTATNGPVTIDWPLGGEPGRFSVDNLNFTLTGPAEASRFNATAALRTVAAYGATLQQVRLQAESEDLNLVQHAGSVRTRLSAASADFVNPDLDRLIEGPIRLDAPIRMAMPAIGLDAATFESGNVSGTISGAFNQSKQTVTGNLRLSLNPDGLPEAAGRYFSDTIGLEGYIDTVIGGRMSLENVVLKSNLLDGHGNVLFENGQLSGTLAGRVVDIARLRKDAKGAVGYDVKLTGPLDALKLAGTVNAADLRISSHTVQGATAKIDGTLAGETLDARVETAANVDGKPVRLKGHATRANGLVAIPELNLEAGNNRVSGGLQLSDSLLPAGRLNFELNDIGVLAAFAGQQASGNLQGAVTLTNDKGVPGATLQATGQSLAAQGVTLDAPQVDLASTDLRALKASGTLRAKKLSAASQTLNDVDLALSQDGARTGLTLGASYFDAPLTLKGALERDAAGGSMSVTIDSFVAKPAGIDVSLSSPARISIANGVTDLGSVTLATGTGRIVLEGSAADRLNIAARISALPAALANGFVDGLGASGTIGGVVTLAGAAATPDVRYSLGWTDAAVEETRKRGIDPFAVLLRGRYQNAALAIEEARLSGQDGLSVSATGTVSPASPGALDIGVTLGSVPASLANSLRPGLAVRGAATGTAKIAGSFAAPSASFDVRLADVSTPETQAAALPGIAGQLQGRFENMTLSLDQVTLGAGSDLAARASGTIGLSGDQPVAVDAMLDKIPAALVNILRPDLGAEGRMTGTVKLQGTLQAPQANLDASWADASLAQTRASGIAPFAVAVRGRFADQTLTLDEARLSGAEGLSLSGHGTASLAGERSINLQADFARLPASLANVARPDLAARGLLDGNVSATGTLSAPVVRYNVSLADGSTAQTRQAEVSALAARMRGSFEGNILTLEETTINDPSGLSLTAAGRVLLTNPQAPALDLNAKIAALPARLANGFAPGLGADGMISGTVSSTGSPEAPAARFDLAWQNVETHQTRSVGLTGLGLTVRGALNGSTLTLDEAALSGPSGLSARASGKVELNGERPLNMQASLSALPASLVSSFLPGIEAGGSVSGTASATGTVANPAVQYDLQWLDGAIRRQGDAGVGQLQLKAEGKYENGRLTLGETRLTGSGGLAITARGNVTPTGPNGPVLDVNADIASLPASLANVFVPSLGATGTISGKLSSVPGNATGGRFDLAWSGASLAQTRSAGVAPFSINANGTLQANRLQFQSRLAGASGLAVTAGGSVGLSGNRPLDIRVEGNLPFALAGAQLAAQGFLLEGGAALNVAVSGTATAPVITGTASTAGARLIDVRRNLALNGINASIRFDRDRAQISSLTAAVSTGGRVSVQGSIGLREGYAADLRIGLDNATYVDGTLVTATVNGALTLQGPLLQSPVLGGTVTLVRANITVPAKLPASLAEIDVKHVNAPPDVRALLESLRPKGGSGTSAGIGLDLRLDAPNGIFVRGRGIDAELGGALTIRGSTIAPEVAGAFDMRRGRIVILTKRLDFTSGRITFGGSLIPVLDMVATTSSGQTTITITVTGQANDPNIAFSSAPALPQDEVLAQLIFGQSMTRLSAVQIAQLADAASQLAGGGDTSLLQTLRSSLGVDDLDINTDDSGQTSVSVGRRLNNRTYLQLEQGGREGGARATINLDVGRGVKLKGSAGSEGGSAGIFYEREY